MIAALLRRAPRTWRSTQLTLALSVPPTNHFACGGFQSSTCVHGATTRAPSAKPAQKASGSRVGARVDALVAHVGLRAEDAGRRERAVFLEEIGDLGSEPSGRPWRIRIHRIHAVAAGRRLARSAERRRRVVPEERAPSRPPSVAKTAPKNSSTMKPKMQPAIDGSRADRLEHRRALRAACRAHSREVARRDARCIGAIRRFDRDRDDQPDERADDAGEQTGAARRRPTVIGRGSFC